MGVFLLGAVVCLLALRQGSCDAGTRNASDIYCANLVPGMNRMRSGWDITAIDMQPMDKGDDMGSRQPVIDFTCNRRKKWVNPKDSTKTQYDLPDQVSNVASLPWGATDFHHYSYKHFTDLRKAMGASAGIDIIGGLFGLSGSYKRALREINAQSLYIEDFSSFVSAFKVDFSPYWRLKLSEDASALVERFPDTFDKEPEIFAEFIKYYGTHYYQDAHFGGTLRMYNAVQKSLYASMNERDVKANGEASFFNWLKVSGAHNQARRNVDARYTAATQNSTRHYGGSGNFAKFPEWERSVAKNPWLFKGSMQPVTNLIVDSKKRTATARGIQVHIDKAYLRELESQLLALPKRLDTDIKLHGDWTLCTRLAGCQATRLTIVNSLRIDFGCSFSGCQLLKAKDNLKARSAAHLAPLRALVANKSPPHAAVQKLGTEIEATLNYLDTRAKSGELRLAAVRPASCPANDLGKRLTPEFQGRLCSEAFRRRRAVKFPLPHAVFPESFRKAI